MFIVRNEMDAKGRPSRGYRVAPLWLRANRNFQYFAKLENNTKICLSNHQTIQCKSALNRDGSSKIVKGAADLVRLGHQRLTKQSGGESNEISCVNKKSKLFRWD